MIKGYESGDMSLALDASLSSAAEGFKFGAIIGALTGGFEELLMLRGLTLNGLTMDEALKIQQESHLPNSVISRFHSVKEYEIYKDAGLQLEFVNNKQMLTQAIDWEYIDSQGVSNAERVLLDGHVPLGPDGNEYYLHHIGQADDSPIAVLSFRQHYGDGNFNILHWNNSNTTAEHGYQWQTFVKKTWKEILRTQRPDLYAALVNGL